jgi:nucleoside-diphosphate-sugar epimerase
MDCLVTGVAGFIGSHLAERLIADGHTVLGVDCFTDYYPRPVKEANLSRLRDEPRFRFVEADLGVAELTPLVDGVDVIFHQAAQAGVRASWGDSFSVYTHHNILATQRLLEVVKGRRPGKFVYASSSSVYGETPDLPMRETSLPRPYSPYGVTKLAAEHLCELYRHNFAVPTVSLRYFTVYGPRQRPDMGFHRFIRAILAGRPVTLYDDGEQTRDFTFITDAVEANLLAGFGDAIGVYNIGGGSRVTINHVLHVLGEVTGLPVQVDRRGRQHGDVRHTWADTTRAREELGFQPKVRLEDGLRAQAAWHVAQAFIDGTMTRDEACV